MTSALAFGKHRCQNQCRPLKTTASCSGQAQQEMRQGHRQDLSPHRAVGTLALGTSQLVLHAMWIGCDEQAGISVVEGAQPLSHHPQGVIDAKARIRQSADIFEQGQAALVPELLLAEGGCQVPPHPHGGGPHEPIADAGIRITIPECHPKAENQDGHDPSQAKSRRRSPLESGDENGEEEESSEDVTWIVAQHCQGDSPADIEPGFDGGRQGRMPPVCGGVEKNAVGEVED